MARFAVAAALQFGFLTIPAGCSSQPVAKDNLEGSASTHDSTSVDPEFTDGPASADDAPDAPAADVITPPLELPLGAKRWALPNPNMEGGVGAVQLMVANSGTSFAVLASSAHAAAVLPLAEATPATWWNAEQGPLGGAIASAGRNRTAADHALCLFAGIDKISCLRVDADWHVGAELSSGTTGTMCDCAEPPYSLGPVYWDGVNLNVLTMRPDNNLQGLFGLDGLTSLADKMIYLQPPSCPTCIAKAFGPGDFAAGADPGRLCLIDSEGSTLAAGLGGLEKWHTEIALSNSSSSVPADHLKGLGENCAVTNAGVFFVGRALDDDSTHFALRQIVREQLLSDGPYVSVVLGSFSAFSSGLRPWPLLVPLPGTAAKGPETADAADFLVLDFEPVQPLPVVISTGNPSSLSLLWMNRAGYVVGTKTVSIAKVLPGFECSLVPVSGKAHTQIAQTFGKMAWATSTRTVFAATARPATDVFKEEPIALILDAFGNVDTFESGPCASWTRDHCHDKNLCTSDLCDAAHGGCFHEPLPDGVGCAQGKVCKAGTCIGDGK